MQQFQAVAGNFVGSGLGALDLVRYTAEMREAPEAAPAEDNALLVSQIKTIQVRALYCVLVCQQAQLSAN